jgi:tetratricopeptide (TPR) repeat protein
MSECEEIATTINRLVKAGYIAKAQELLELSLDDYFVLQLAMFADKKVNAYTTIAAWKQAGLRLPAEDIPEFYPYGDSPSATDEQLKAEVDKLKEEIPSRLPVKTTFKNTMRWIAVLPAAILFVPLVWFPVHWAVMLIHFLGNYFGLTGISTEEGKDILAAISVDTLERFGDAFFSPFTFVFVGAYVAPSHKFPSGIFLATLYSTGVIALMTVVAPHYGIHITDGPLRIGALALTGIAGISCGLFQARKADQDAYDAFRTGKQIWMDSLTGGDPPELRESKKEEALRHFDQAIVNGFDTSEAFSCRGSCLNDLGFYFDAVEDYDKAIQKHPTKAIAANYYTRSQIKQSLLDLQGSLSDLNEAIRLSKLDNDDNRWWDKHVQKIGYNSHTAFCEESLSWLKRLIEREETHPTDKSVELSKIKRRDLG